MAYKFQVGDAIVSGSLTRDAGDIKVRNHANVERASVSRAGVVSGSGEAVFGSIDSDGAIDGGSFEIAGTSIVSSARQLQNIATLDATTETTIETAIDSLINLVTIGQTGQTSVAKGPLDLEEGLKQNGSEILSDAGALSGLTTISGSGLGSFGQVRTDGGITQQGVTILSTGKAIQNVASVAFLGALSGAFGSSATLANGRFAVSNAGVLSGSGAGGAGQIAIGPGMHVSGGFGSSLSLADAKFTVSAGGNLVAGGTVQLSAITADTALDVAADGLFFNDGRDGTVKNVNISSFCTDIAGSGLVQTSNQLAVNVGNNGGLAITGDALEITGSNVVTGVAAVASETLLFLNADGTLAKESFVDYAAAIAGAGLSASGGVLSTDAGAVNPVSDVTDVLSEGYNYLTGTAGASVKLPIDAAIGDVVHIKNSTAGVCNIARQSNHTIDGLNSIVLESARGAVSMVYALTSSWLLV
jgi:hypothetical protein